MTKVLIVEDEPKVADSLKKWLEENSYLVDVAPDGAVGRHLARSNSYDIVLLDLNLPFVNGFEVCKDLKLLKPEMPVMLVTALDSIDQKLTGFEVGADDYIVKPFDFRELLARIRLHTKRSQTVSPVQEANEVLRIADLELDVAFKTVSRSGVPITLTAKEFSLLEFLLRRGGRVATRHEIVESVWDVNFDTGTNVVDVYINFLRRKIDRNFEPKLIHTKQGMGYYLKVQ